VNRIHNMLCSSSWWARRVEDKLVPWGLEGLELGDRVLEIGPGFGATTRLLASQLPRLTVVELDGDYCERLRKEIGDKVEVLEGDATELPFAADQFSAVICFTMLHHVPERAMQDRALSEAARVLQPGGWFAGTDSIGTGAVFKLIHIGDTLLPLDPATLPDRLGAAGLIDAEVQRREGSFRFRAMKPCP
jgi:ubiquinone/menaquinone biosynthesis C-methylase UbiE